jgi:hypothetical protein
MNIVRRLVVGGLAAGVLLWVGPACSSGIGFRTEPNPWTQICLDEKTYLSAQAGGGAPAVRSAITHLNEDRTSFPDDPTGTEWLDRVYQGAVAGNPEVARQFWSGNCAHSPYDPPTPSPVVHPSSN